MRKITTLIVIILMIAALALAGCSSNKTRAVYSSSKTSATTADTSGPTIVSATCTARWTCSGDERYYVNSDCSHTDREMCPDGCSGGLCVGKSTTVTPPANKDPNPTIFKSVSTEDGDLLKTDVFELLEGEEAVVDINGELIYVKALVIDEASGTVKFKINNERSFGIKEGSQIILKSEEDEEDEIIIEVVRLGFGTQKSVQFRFAKIK